MNECDPFSCLGYLIKKNKYRPVILGEIYNLFHTISDQRYLKLKFQILYTNIVSYTGNMYIDTERKHIRNPNKRGLFVYVLFLSQVILKHKTCSYQF